MPRIWTLPPLPRYARRASPAQSVPGGVSKPQSIVHSCGLTGRGGGQSYTCGLSWLDSESSCDPREARCEGVQILVKASQRDVRIAVKADVHGVQVSLDERG